MSFKRNNKKAALFLATVFFAFTMQGQNLEEYIKTALENNPEVQQFDTKYKRISEKKEEVNTLPNTEFGAGYFVSTPETRTGPQRFKLSVKQMIPFFGTITARENYVSSLADAAYQDIVIVKRKLATSVAQLYYKLYEIKAKQKVLDENIELLKTYEKLALTSVEVGKASAVDVLRLQIRQNELNQQKEVLVETFSGIEKAFNRLLNQEVNTSISVVNSLQVPKEADKIQPSTLKLHPELIKFDKLYTSVEQSEFLNQKEKQPMIGFGLDYVNVEKRTDMNMVDNGKDIIMPMVSLSIPIFNKKNKSISKQNKLQQEEILSQKEQRYNTLESVLYRAVSDRNAAMISHRTQLKNLEQAKNAEQILVKSYETGTIDFNDVLDIQELQLKFQTNMITSVVNYYTQSTIINYLIQ
ncbi:Outer membrane protein TolC [Tenacibaculum mesophilum]|uniref:TolC family protein n=1 Tax=Tenacibaculum mesophilum TaxID=104268 RepID=A0ABM7CIU8_9FLAO|nr:TolC family protein [Tenacibaculum mesophilum]KAF9659974.1 TolC family protein [Tenacibaculum mesophilum]QFS28988.1 TolC family protein [Tenacibaculum mesophilum]SHF54450.1 Outer membrane protein TolC [Tenacibaculum mesophilum]